MPFVVWSRAGLCWGLNFGWILTLCGTALRESVGGALRHLRRSSVGAQNYCWVTYTGLAFLTFLFTYLMFMSVLPACLSVYLLPGAKKGQKRSDPLELGLQMVVNNLAPEPSPQPTQPCTLMQLRGGQVHPSLQHCLMCLFLGLSRFAP